MCTCLLIKYVHCHEQDNKLHISIQVLWKFSPPPPQKKIKIKSQLPRDTSFRRNIIEQNRKYHSKLKKKISHTNLAIISKILVQVTTSIKMKYIPGDIKINIFILTLVKASYDHGYF